MQSAKRHGVIVSNDLNYPRFPWKIARRQKTNASDVNRPDICSARRCHARQRRTDSLLPLSVTKSLGMDEASLRPSKSKHARNDRQSCKGLPFQVVATTLRKAKTATLNDWGRGSATTMASFYQAKNRENLEILRPASAAAIPSHPASSTASSPGKTRSGLSNAGAAHGALPR